MSVDTPEAHIDRTIFSELQEGVSDIEDIANNTMLTRQYVQRRLELLEEDGYVESTDRDVYGVALETSDEDGDQETGR